MANIVPTKPLDIEKELGDLSLYKYHPNAIINLSLNRLSDILNGRLEIVEPFNPFVYLIETSSLNTAFAIKEHTLLMRKLYPRLANNEKDLYLHMSDFDYLGRFSEPAFADIHFNILLNDFESKAYVDPTTKDKIVKIPRHYQLSIGGYIFTLPNAIIIRKAQNGVIDVKYENESFNSIFPITTNYINFDIQKLNQEETYIHFSVKVPEIQIETVELPIEKSKLFKNTFTFNPSRKFYYFRAFYYKDNNWHEMLVTHTDEVYDINTPTTIIKVYQDSHEIEYYIPSVYINTNRLGTKVKFLIYTTNGYINVNFKDFKLSEYELQYNNVFPDIELDESTESINLITKFTYIPDSVIGGKDEIDFNTLKQSVIDNSIGDRKLPITESQLGYFAAQNNFTIIKDIDTVTNRIYLLQTTLPKALTRYPLSRINMDLIEFKTTINDLRQGNNITFIGEKATILPERTLFKLENDTIRLLTPEEYDTLKSLSDYYLINECNSNNYLSLFYHYILDHETDEAELRVYDLTQPKINNINFKDYNNYSRVGVNSIAANIGKTKSGYIIDVMVNFKKYDDAVTQNDIVAVLSYLDNDETRFFLEGRLYTILNDNPVYRFEIESNFFINKDNKINLINFKDQNNITTNIFIDLNSKIDILFLSEYIPQNYTPTTLDTLIYNSYLLSNRIVVTQEELNIEFGKTLEYLYKRLHSSTGDQPYATYDSDVYLTYSHDVYDSNNNIIHYKNEIVLDENGNPIIQHRKGDVILDDSGNPILLDKKDINYYLTLLLVDYRPTIATKKSMVDYLSYTKSYLTEIITVNAANVQPYLLENTVGYVGIPKTISSIRVRSIFNNTKALGDSNNININISNISHLQNDETLISELTNLIKQELIDKNSNSIINVRETTINSSQSFGFKVIVNENIYKDISIRENISYLIITELDNYLVNNTILKKTVLLDTLYNKLKEFIISIVITKFTELDAEYIEILDKNARIGINKKLILEANVYDIKEDVDIVFEKVV